MSWFINLVLIVIVAGGTLGGLMRGIRRELLNVAGLAVSVAGGILLAKPVAALVSGWGVVEEVPYLLAFLLGFVASSLAFSILKTPLVPRERDIAERVSGAAVGLGKGLLLSAVLLYLLIGVFPGVREPVQEAPASAYVLPLTPAVDRLAGWLERVLPREFTDRVQEGYEVFRRAGEGIGRALEDLEEAGEKAKTVGEGVREGVSAADSLARSLQPPPR
ncbi:MAG: CvpA family protein [bacterium]